MYTLLKFNPNSIQLHIQNEMIELGNKKIRAIMMEDDTTSRSDPEEVNQIPVRITSCKAGGDTNPRCHLMWKLPIQDIMDGQGYLEIEDFTLQILTGFL